MWSFERESLVAMDTFYCIKSLRILPHFRGDGFAIAAGSADKPNLLLLTSAFASAAGVPGQRLLGVSLLTLMQRLTRHTQPETATALSERLKAGEQSVRIIFPGRRPAPASSTAAASMSGAAAPSSFCSTSASAATASSTDPMFGTGRSPPFARPDAGSTPTAGLFDRGGRHAHRQGKWRTAA